MTFEYFIIDNMRYDCKPTGCPDFTRISARKKLGHNEVIHEKEFLKFVKRSAVMADYKDTDTYRYFDSKLPKLLLIDVAALGRMLAYIFNNDLMMPREVYRRMNTTMYWFIMNWGTVARILTNHEIIGIHSKWGKIYFDSPDYDISYPIFVPSKSALQKAIQNE